MSKLYDLLNTLITNVNASVKTTAQTLTETQKVQVRQNIGAAAVGEGGGGGASEEDPIAALIETDMLPSFHNGEGKLVKDIKGNIVLRY